MRENCAICGEPHGGSGIGMGNGALAHPRCYYRENPPFVSHTLYHVARGGADPVLAADVISEFVPTEIAERIVDEFNRRLMKQWRRRCEP